MKKGDIVLIKYPFTDLTSDKVRPALVISTEKHNQSSQDALFIAISSVVDSPQEFDYLISSDSDGFNKTGLRKTSLIKTDKIFCLLQSNAASLLGELNTSMLCGVDSRLRDILDLPAA